MQLVFIYGQVASGKLTIAREVAEQTGVALFHNHLVVDAVAAVFPFGSEPFVRLRELFWLEVISEAARTERSVIFTFAPEPTVKSDFPNRVQELVEARGGKVVFIALSVSEKEQERRLIEPSRAAFGKLRSLDLLRQLRKDFSACTASMPMADITIDTDRIDPREAARIIISRISA
ncbi:AAA family ATPase [Bosea sp. (in: a-proteobacteria)]|jgi:hypothetical protein|uniref:AAA family ATPase n=1 Tax=Bosea sp. (in: a-proteobacteria) TaxID=1871050 RepID=UPI003F72B99E